MKPNPTIEITGPVTRFGLESDVSGAVLVVYTEDENGQVGRSWLRFDQAATRALKTRAAELSDFPTEETAPAPADDAANTEADRPGFPRYKLVPGPIDPDVPGWELTGDKETGEYITECHETFRPDDQDADIEAALTWAEQIIGAAQKWVHVRERGFDRWEAGTRD